MNFILKSCDILTKNRNKWIIVPNRSVVIKDGYIDKIVKDSISLKDFKVIDCIDKIIMPTFCNAHIHLGDTFFRGMVNNVTIDQYIKRTELYNKKFNDFERRELSAQVTLLDLAKNGTASCCVSRGWPVFKNIDLLGMDILTGYMVMNITRLLDDYKNLESKFDLQKTEMEKIIESNLKMGIFIHSVDLVNKDILKKVKSIADKYKNTKIIIHTSETRKRKNKKSDLKILDENGLISKNTILIHCIYLAEDDYKILKKRKPDIVLCPASNLKILSGIADYKALSDTGCNISIATDGVGTGNSFNLLEEARLASMIYNYKAGKFIIDENRLLDSIISNPLKALGFSKAGLIKDGFKANIIIIDKNFIGIQPKKSIIHNIVFSGNPDMISEVIIGGKQVINEGKYTRNISSLKKTINSFNKLYNKI